MKAKIKHDEEFFYKFMMAHGYKQMDVFLLLEGVYIRA